MSETLEDLKAENTRLKQELADLLLQKSETLLQSETSLERVSFLEAMLETIPIGIVLADAPSDKITAGNSLA